MTMLSRIRELFTRPVTRTIRKAPRRVRLAVEELESRWCPSTFTVTSSLDDGSSGSLRWAVAQVNNSPSATGDTIQLADTLTGGQTITLLSTLNINSSSGTLTISAAGATPVTIDGTNSMQDIYANRDLVLDNLIIANGLAGNGAGIYDTGNVTAQSCTFSGNTASYVGMLDGTAEGGAIYSGANVTATDCTFQSNSASASPSVFGNGFGYGGAIYSGANVMAINCTFDTNSASGSGLGYASGIGFGGAVYSGAKVMAINCTFDTNSASGSSSDGDGDGFGGAIYSYSVGVTATGCTFDANYAKGVKTNPIGGGSAYGEGGAIYSYTDVTATNCTFDANYGEGDIATAQVSGTSTFSAYGEGGAIYSYADVTATNCTFDANYAFANFFYFVGYSNPPPPSTSTTYSVEASGGAIYSNGPATVTNCTLDANHAEGDSYYFDYWPGTNNGTYGAGGAVYASSGTIVNCIFADNYGQTSEDGGVTFSNSASGAVLGLVATPLALDSCLFFANGSDNVSDYVGATADSNCLFGANPHLGLLQDNGGPTWTMALGTTTGMVSPAIDAGTTAGAPLVDQRGFVRSSQPDLGAYEVSSTNPVITVTTDSTPQSAAVGTAFANPLSVTVTTSPGGTAIPNYTVILQAPTSGASGTFSSDGLSTVALTTDSSGTAGDTFTANTIVGGPYTVSGDGGLAGTFSFSLTNTADVPYSVTVSGGSQSAPVSTAFSTALVATVKDQYGNVVPGASVTFTAPASTGAGGTFSNSTNTITATTDSNGQVSEVLTADMKTGTYSVGVAVAGGLNPINDTISGLTNTADVPYSVTVSGGSQNATVGTAFSTALVATVKDQSGKVLSGASVTFTAPASTGAGGTFSNSTNSITATTDSNGQVSEVLTADTHIGTYDVGVAVAGGLNPINNTISGLTNIADVPYSMTVSGGSQSAPVGTAFPTSLLATVKDQYGNVVSGASVTFTAPASTGAGGTFSNRTNSITATTDSSGQLSEVLTADTHTGTYNVGVAVAGGLSAINDTISGLTNTSVSLGALSFAQWTVNKSGYSGTIAVSGGTGNYTLTSVAGLPAGITQSLSGSILTLSGKPKATGTFTIKVTVKDDSNNTKVTKRYTFTVLSSTTFAWTGLGGDNMWTDAANWSGAAPAAGDALIFGAGAAQQANVNDLAPGTEFASITFQDNSYNITGNDIQLSGGIKSTSATGGGDLLGLNIALTKSEKLNIGGTTIITVAGAISGSTFGITKSGTGTLILSGANSYLGTTTVSAGVLGGSGTVAGAVKVSSGATLAPGSTVTAILNTGNLTLVSHSTFTVTLNGTAAGTDYDQLNVTGTVNLGSASLDINANLLSTSVVGDKFTIIQNDGSDAVVGTFHGLAEGATITQGGVTFTISYKGGDGNDVVLTRTA